MFNRKDKDIKIFNDYKHSIKIAALLSMFSLITLTITGVVVKYGFKKEYIIFCDSISFFGILGVLSLIGFYIYKYFILHKITHKR